MPIEKYLSVEMKKNFYRQPKRRSFGPLKIISLLAIAGVLLFVLIRIFFAGTLEGTLKTLAHPLWSNGNHIASALYFIGEALGGERALVEENRELKQKLISTETLQLRNSMLEEENAALLELFGRREFKSLVLAPVLRRPPGTFYDTLLVDLKNVSNVSLGNRVVVDGRIVLGSLSALDGAVGTVVLFSTPGVETEVFIGTTTASVIARGRGSGNFVAEVPRELGVRVGDTVTLSGLPTLLFAEVEEIVSNSADPFELALFQSPVNVQTLRWVQIVTDDSETPVESLTATSTLPEGDAL